VLAAAADALRRTNEFRDVVSAISVAARLVVDSLDALEADELFNIVRIAAGKD
jgi:hypothetical protein